MARSKVYTVRPYRVDLYSDVGSGTAEMVGDPATVWSDDDDATYVQANVSTLNTNWTGRGQGHFTTPVGAPVMHAGTFAQISVRMTGGDGRGPWAILREGGVDHEYVNPSGSIGVDPDGWARLSLTTDASTVMFYLDTGLLNIEVRPPQGSPGGSLWYFHELKLEWLFPIRYLEPLRQRPRADGLGASSARRRYPPERSLQGGQRRAGAYF